MNERKSSCIIWDSHRPSFRFDPRTVPDVGDGGQGEQGEEGQEGQSVDGDEGHGGEVQGEHEGGGLEASDQEVVVDRGLPTDLCLERWRNNLEFYPTLSSMLDPPDSFICQIIDFSLFGGKPTGEVVITDGQFSLKAMLGAEGSERRREYTGYLAQRRFGKFSLVKISETAGPPEELILVRNIISPLSFGFVCC